MKNIKIFKIGGSMLEKPTDFLKIGKKIVENYPDSKICIITSAMKGKTDNLIETFKNAVPKPNFWDFEKFIPLGEIESSLLFESVFNYLNISAKSILPWHKEWPLYISFISKRNFLEKGINEKRNFKILEKSKLKIKKYVLPLFKNYKVIIFPGFIAKDIRERILTLGRGGSDISAILIAKLIGSKEVIFLKDTGGVMNADPKLFQKPKKIKIIELQKLALLASSGAKILNPIALKYADNIRKIKITSPESKSGTNVKFEEDTIYVEKEMLSVLTFIGEKFPQTPGILYRISKILYENKISIYSITISDSIIAIYLKEEEAEIAYKILYPLLSEIENLKILNIKKGIKKIVLRSLKFINEPGIIKKFVTPISKEGINIWEILTVHTDIMIFVEKEYANKTFEILKNLFNKKEKK
uniref:ACT domain-containing protein n=1 Tax=candidate division WOR-3 bacterium TaxID=2052148 RepID=A0A7V4E390_UNCW3